MKTKILTLSSLIILSIALLGFKKMNNSTIDGERICFVLKGNQKSTIKIGIGLEPGKGACCSGLSAFAAPTFCGEVGHVVYDGDTKRVLLRITKDLKGKTIDLKPYY